MQTIIQIKTIAELSKREYKALWAMTNPDRGSMMRTVLEDQYSIQTKVAIARNHRGTSLGWAMIVAERPNVFVKSQYRRQGIGRSLLSALRQKVIAPDLQAVAWNRTGYDFYLSCKVPCLLDIVSNESSRSQTA